MTLLCMEYKVVSVEYFLDKMRYYELRPILKNIDVSVKSDWEQTRLVSYIVAQANSSKKISPTDIVSFSWDKEKKDAPSALTPEMREEMLKKAKLREEKLRKQGII